MNNVIFLDNHDANRIFSEVGGDIDKQKMGLAWLLTERGVPQIYYGTEIAMAGAKDHDHGDGLLRGDFFGGWKEDKNNKFTGEGRTEKENDLFNYTRKLANFRKTSSAIKYGKMTQFVPDNEVYTYFRYDGKQTVMVVMNTATKEKTIHPIKFIERTTGFSKANDVVTGDSRDLKADWKMPGKTAWVFELK
jgi:glycosidase